MTDSNKCVPWTNNMINDELVNVILQKTHTKKFTKGQLVFLEGEVSDKYYLLLDGRIEISICNFDGRKKIISIHEPRIFFGELIFSCQPRLTNATCLTDVTVAVLDKELSLGSEEYDKQLYSTLLYLSNLKLRTQMIQLGEVAFSEVENRVKNLIFGLCANFGQDNDKYVQVNLPLTHQLIADFVGSSRVRVSQVLSDFSKKDKIQVRRHEIILHKVNEARKGGGLG